MFALLGGGHSSRLYQSLVYDKKLAESVEVEQRTLFHGSEFVIVGCPATIGRAADCAHVVADAFEQHDRESDHLGVPEHVAAEPERHPVIAYSHLASSWSVSCRRAKVLMRGKYVGSCLTDS